MVRRCIRDVCYLSSRAGRPVMGCGGGNQVGSSSTSSPGTNNPTQSNPPPNNPSPPPAAGAQYVFLAQGNAPSGSTQYGTLAEFKMDPSTGSLSAISTSINTPNHAYAVFRDAQHKFLYVRGPVPNQNSAHTSSVISGYQVDASTGALSSIPGSPFDLNQQELALVAVRRDERFAYISDFFDASKVHIVSMDPSSGAMLQEIGSISVPNRSNALLLMVLRFDPSGRFLYFADTEQNSIAGYSSDTANGQLTPIPGSPFKVRVPTPHGCSIKSAWCGGDLAASGNYLYYSSTLLDGTAAFRIDAVTGALAELLNSPFPNPAHEALPHQPRPAARSFTSQHRFHSK